MFLTLTRTRIFLLSVRTMTSTRIPFYRVQGTHYECAKSIGQLTRDAIQRRITNDFTYLSSLFTFVQSAEGRKLQDDFIETTKTFYPWYWDEIQGLADGSEVPLEQIVALNFLNEIRTAFRLEEEKQSQKTENETGEKGCTTVLINRTDKNICSLLHNEDHATALFMTGYLVLADIQSSFYSEKNCSSPKEKFLAYCYAGGIPGNAFGANIHGFACSLNGLYPNFIAQRRLPRQIVNRALLSVRNENELDRILHSSPVAYGFCVNAGFYPQTNSLLNYEIGPNLKIDQENFVSKCRILSSDDSSKLNENETDDECSIKWNFLIHYNHYERLNDVIVQQKSLVSSYSRSKRGEEFGEIFTIDDALRLLGDHENEAFPIFRVANRTDFNSVTLCSVHIDFRTFEMLIYENNPKDNPQAPVYYKLVDLLASS